MMRTAKYLLALWVVCLFTAPAQAAEVEEVVSPGGITAWLIEDHSLPVTAMEFSFEGSGAEMDPEGKAGLADMASSLIDEGAGPYDSEAFQGILNDQSITLRFSAGRDSFSGSFYTLNRYRDQAFELLKLSLTEPRFDDEPVARIRNQVIVGLKREQSNPNSVANKALMAKLFPDHAYGTPVSGTTETVRDITKADMTDFVGKAFTRDRLHIGVVGDITAEDLAAMLDRVFGGLPEGDGVPADAAVTPQTDGRTEVAELDIPQSVIAFAQQGVDRHDPDFYPAYILNHILGGGGFTSRLTEEIREKRGLAYSVYSSLYTLEDVALFYGSAATRNERVKETVALLRQVWRDTAENGVTQQELDDAKTYLTGAYPLRFTNTSRTAGILAAIQAEGLGIDFIDRRNGLVEAVTLEQVNRVARERLNPDALSVIVVGKPKGVKSDTGS